MHLLDNGFNELMERIRRGREPGHASFEPLYRFIFAPAMILQAKRRTPAWTARLKKEGWDVHLLSMYEQITGILGNARQRKFWITGDQREPLNWERTNKSLSNALTNGSLLSVIEEKLDTLKNNSKGILLITDTEALHPYLRISTIENSLYGKITVPAVFFYPGEPYGKFQSKFLGFHRDDGNYRSVYVSAYS